MSQKSNEKRRKSPWLNDREDHELSIKKQLVIQLYQQGYKRREIAERVCVTHSSVKNWIEAYQALKTETNQPPQ